MSLEPTLEEERILGIQRDYLSSVETHGLQGSATVKIQEELETAVKRYKRDGCKEQLVGDWRFAQTGDAINISYDDQYKVFIGRVTRVVSFDPDWVKPGYILFKVYFPKQQTLGYYWNDEEFSLNELRPMRTCLERFTGEEYSFERQGDRMVETKSTINIQSEENPSEMKYMTDKNYTLIRAQ